MSVPLTLARALSTLMCPGMLRGESCWQRQSLPMPHPTLFSPAFLFS